MQYSCHNIRINIYILIKRICEKNIYILAGFNRSLTECIGKPSGNVILQIFSVMVSQERQIELKLEGGVS